MIVHAALGAFFTKKLIAVLNQTYFSIVIDETTDVSTESKLGIVLQYFCPVEFELKVNTLDLTECVDATAIGITFHFFISSVKALATT